MNVNNQIAEYMAAQPARKRGDMHALHAIIQALMPCGRLWFLDGKDQTGKTISNPNIGYGFHIMTYADGSTKDFYQIGMSANTAGISIYILGLRDKTYLSQTYGKTLGKANVSGYCIKFRALRNIHIEILQAAMRDGIEQSSA